VALSAARAVGRNRSLDRGRGGGGPRRAAQSVPALSSRELLFDAFWLWFNARLALPLALTRHRSSSPRSVTRSRASTPRRRRPRDASQPSAAPCGRGAHTRARIFARAVAPLLARLPEAQRRRVAASYTPLQHARLGGYDGLPPERDPAGMRELASLEGGMDADEASQGGADHWAAAAG
jgi:hypothetical protein